MQNISKIVMVLVLLFLVACSSPPLSSAQEPTTKNVPTSEVTTRVELFPVSVYEQARDLAVAYVADLAGLAHPDGEWVFQDQTPEEETDSSAWLFTNGPWVVQVSVPALAPEETIYAVTVDHMSAVIRWEGTVDSFGEIIETNIIRGSLPAAPEMLDENSWIGVVVSNPPGSQFDDYFQLMDQNGTRYGIDGVDDLIRERLAAHRDSGVIIQVWGSLQKEVPDAYGAQILVIQIETRE